MTYLDKELVPGYGCGRDAVDILKNMEKLNHIPFMEHNRALLERYEEIARVHGMTEAE